MATVYHISFTNNHDEQGSSSNYCFFNQKPVVDGNTADPNCFTNIWVSKRVPAGDTIDITTTASYYAWTGTAPREVAKGVTIGTGKGLLATLGTDKAAGSTFAITNDGGTPDIGPDVKNTGNPSAYQINTGTDFQRDDLFLVGLGLHDDKGKLVPSAVIPADQNMATNIMPLVKFYVSKNSSSQGTVVDFASESLIAGVIDFTDPAHQGKQFANVSHDSNGLFTVKFSDQASFNSDHAARLGGMQNDGGSQDVSQLQFKIAELEELFKAFLAKGNPVDPDANPIVLFTATVGWLRNTTPAVMRAGWAIIWNYLQTHGWSGNYVIDTAKFTVTLTVTVVPKPPQDDLLAGAVPPYILTDWHSALAQDAKDKPIDNGIIPGAPKKAMSQLKQEARQYLQNQGVVANGN